MSYTSLPQLMKAIVARLRGHAPLMALVTGVHDAVPDSKAFPYVVLDDPLEFPERYFGQNGHRVSLTIFVYTKDGTEVRKGVGTAGFKSGFDIAEIVLAQITDIEGNPLVVDNHDLVDADVIALTANRLEDGVTREIELELEFVLEDA